MDELISAAEDDKPREYVSVVIGSKAAEETRETSNLVAYAEDELNREKLMPGNADNDFYRGMIGGGVVDLMKVFAAQGHSGMSAPYGIQLFTRLAMFKPLSPLTGEDSEWNEVGSGVFQNNRCSHIFKGMQIFDGRPYNSEAVIFEDEDGIRYSDRGSAREIEFPYTVPDYPEIVKIKAPEGNDADADTREN